MIIPNFAPNGALPPFVDGSPANPAKRSPFGADIFQLVDRFCTTKQRAELLKVPLNSYSNQNSLTNFQGFITIADSQLDVVFLYW